MRLIYGEDHTKHGAGGKPIDPVPDKYTFRIRLPNGHLARGKGGRVRIFEQLSNAQAAALPLKGKAIQWGQRADFPPEQKVRKRIAGAMAKLAPADSVEASRLRQENEELKAQLAAQNGGEAKAPTKPRTPRKPATPKAPATKKTAAKKTAANAAADTAVDQAVGK